MAHGASGRAPGKKLARAVGKHTSKKPGDRLDAARHYQALFGVGSTPETDAAAIRLSLFVESVIAFLSQTGKR